MRFDQFYSSSSGNLGVVTANNGTRLLIECGVTWAALQKALDYDLTRIAGCLLSHEHKDHSKAVKDVIRAGIQVYTAQGTLEVLGLDGMRSVQAIRGQSALHLPSFTVRAFSVNHDAVDPLCFIVTADNERMLFASDTSHIRQRFTGPFSIIAIECSYDKDILEKRVDTSDISEALAKRLLSSHMEKQVAMQYLADFCDLSKCRQIHLLHMSGDNIDKKATCKEFEERFFIETVIAWSDERECTNRRR